MVVNVLFDPRDPDQREDAPETWKPTNNPAIILRHLQRVSAPKTDWVSDARIIEMADYCDARPTSPPADDPPASPDQAAR